MAEPTQSQRRLMAGADLSEGEAAEIIGALMDESIAAEGAAALLKAWAAKGETVEELTGAAKAMRDRSLVVEHSLPLVMDVVGSGGDGARTINISTIAALVVAAAGVPVAKHGNRAASSVCGSADVLEASGVAIDVSPEQASQSLRELGFTFLFAPRYHPAMKQVAPIRKSLGIRTIFNLLGPLTNPARATHLVVGVPSPEYVVKIGNALQALGVQAGAVVHSGGMDEVGGEGPTAVYEFGNGRTKSWTLDPVEYGVRASAKELTGDSVGDCENALGCVLAGERSPRADVVALNAALALRVSGKAADIHEGMKIARVQLAEGRAAELLARVAKFSHG